MSPGSPPAGPPASAARPNLPSAQKGTKVEELGTKAAIKEQFRPHSPTRGEVYHYSDTGYTLLAMAVEKVGEGTIWGHGGFFGAFEYTHASTASR
ncbi:hypothetical protein [Streptosporangium sp. NPDC002607]